MSLLVSRLQQLERSFLKCKYDHDRSLLEISVALKTKARVLLCSPRQLRVVCPVPPTHLSVSPLPRPLYSSHSRLSFGFSSIPNSCQPQGLCTNVPAIWNIPHSPSPLLLSSQLPLVLLFRSQVMSQGKSSSIP